MKKNKKYPFGVEIETSTKGGALNKNVSLWNCLKSNSKGGTLKTKTFPFGGALKTNTKGSTLKKNTVSFGFALKPTLKGVPLQNVLLVLL